MKFKLDENLSREVIELFLSEGYDVHTVHQENLSGSNDHQIFKQCCKENRCLITCDLDFSDITRFDARKSGGIIVIRLPKNSSHSNLLFLVKQLLKSIKLENHKQKLWIVENGRIRIHQRDE